MTLVPCLGYIRLTSYDNDAAPSINEADKDDGYLQLRENERQWVENLKILKKNQKKLEEILCRWDRK